MKTHTEKHKNSSSHATICAAPQTETEGPRGASADGVNGVAEGDVIDVPPGVHEGVAQDMDLLGGQRQLQLVQHVGELGADRPRFSFPLKLLQGRGGSGLKQLANKDLEPGKSWRSGPEKNSCFPKMKNLDFYGTNREFMA